MINNELLPQHPQCGYYYILTCIYFTHNVALPFQTHHNHISIFGHPGERYMVRVNSVLLAPWTSPLYHLLRKVFPPLLISQQHTENSCWRQVESIFSNQTHHTMGYNRHKVLVNTCKICLLWRKYFYINLRDESLCDRRRFGFENV